MTTRLERIETNISILTENSAATRERMARVETKLDNHLQLHTDSRVSKRWTIGLFTGMGSAIAGLAAVVVQNYRTLHPQ